MQLSDAELLLLATDGLESHDRRITRIEQRPEPEPLPVVVANLEPAGDHALTLTRTDGSSESFQLPAGPAGPAGEPGRDGVDGRDGSDGRDGADGKDGQDGEMGPAGEPGSSIDGISLDGAALVVALTDGTDYRVPAVVGNDGKDGKDGRDGKAGPAGPRGPAGQDGATILSGKGRPKDSVGKVGDLYFDLSSELLDFYGPKTADGWGRRTAQPEAPPSLHPAGRWWWQRRPWQPG